MSLGSTTVMKLVPFNMSGSSSTSDSEILSSSSCKPSKRNVCGEQCGHRYDINDDIIDQTVVDQARGMRYLGKTITKASNEATQHYRNRQ